MSLFIEAGGAAVDYGEYIGGGASIGAGLSGSVQVTANESSFVLPPNPATTYTFAARMTGQFTASAGVLNGCGTDSTPPCDALAVLSIDLPGTLTISFIHDPNPAAPYELTETFASVPEPSSVRLWLLGAGMGGTVWLARRRKARSLSC
ncbi:MAG: PEP-CTERM sorting domain-containing protein [Acidobacteria bacterium]|nr:PEP-CTERM sorting domain-containing protein [Acidobacteriota bacterium]